MTIIIDLGQGVKADTETTLVLQGAPCRQRAFLADLKAFANGWVKNAEKKVQEAQVKPCGCQSAE